MSPPRSSTPTPRRPSAGSSGRPPTNSRRPSWSRPTTRGSATSPTGGSRSNRGSSMSKTHPGDLMPRHVRIDMPELPARPAGPPGASRPASPLPDSASTRSAPDPRTTEAPIVAHLRARPPADDLHRDPLPELPARASASGRDTSAAGSAASIASTNSSLSRNSHAGVMPHRPDGAIAGPRREKPTVEDVPTRTAGHRVPETHPRNLPTPRADETTGSSRPAAPARPAPTPPGGRGGPRSSRRWPRPACSAAAALYLKGPSLADYGRLVHPGSRDEPTC